MPPPSSLMQLLRVCLTGHSSDAWCALVERLRPLIAAAVVRTFFRYCRRRPEPDLIDDLIQQVFLKIFADKHAVLRKLEGLDEAAFQAYVRATAGHCAIDHLRTRKMMFEPLDPALPDGRGEFAGEIESTEEIERHLVSCCGEDPVRDRAIFWLYYREGLRSREIAAIERFRLTPKGVQSVLLRLTRCLRQAIAEGISRPVPFDQEGGGTGTATRQASKAR